MPRQIYVSFFLLLSTLPCLSAQSTFARVYDILQQKCINCHSNGNPQSGLDLEGSGASVTAKQTAVFNNIVGKTPANTHAAQKKYDYIYPGRPDLSFLFRKVNQGLEETISLHSDEKSTMPPATEDQLTNVEKEMIRQWILYGAPVNGIVVEEQLVDDYYNKNGLAAFPGGPPPAPAPSEGFQIKMGPFFLPPAGNPGDEQEYFQKYELDLPEDVDVNRVDIKISNYSHHLILYDFKNVSSAQNVAPGLRTYPFHFDIGLVAAVQEQTNLNLPDGTAFPWNKDRVLDLNTHYINYSSTNTYKAEAYINIYTSEAGSAEQIMHTELIANTNIPIPNNGDRITHEQVVNYDLGDVFIWALMGHTHKYGRDYKVFRRENRQATELLYDASCPQGVPDCVSPNFDYQHIPILYFEPFLPLKMDFSNGLLHRAQWVNEGPTSVNFGLTSDDEMMVLVVMFLTDTTGVTLSTGTKEFNNELSDIAVFPNPAQSTVTFTLPVDVGNYNLTLFDALGRQVFKQSNLSQEVYTLDRNHLSRGLFFYRIETDKGRFKSGTLVFE